MLKLCIDDPIVKLMRETFSANPIRIPEERIQPLVIFGVKKNKKKYLGAISFLLDGNVKLDDVERKKSRLADVSTSKSKSVSTKFGLKIMDGFLKGLGANSAALDHSFKGVSKVSFSFQNVYRQYVDIVQIMKILGSNKVDTENPVTKAFISEKMKCVLVTSIITSNNFTIKAESYSSQNVELNIPEIEGILSLKNNKIKVSSTSKHKVSFKGTKQLGFAFEGVQLIISNDGSIDLDNESDEMFLAVVPEDKKEPRNLPMYLDDELCLIEIECYLIMIFF